MNEFNQKASKVLNEQFKSIKHTKRVFYPRNFNVSDEFINALKKEFVKHKTTKAEFLVRLKKALDFHI